MLFKKRCFITELSKQPRNVLHRNGQYFLPLFMLRAAGCHHFLTALLWLWAPLSLQSSGVSGVALHAYS